MSTEWQTEAFRGSLVRKLEEAIRESGVQNQRTAVEMENQVFQRAKGKEEYLGFVAKLILHVKQQGRSGMQNADGSQGMNANMHQTRVMNPNNMQQMQQNRMQMQVSQQQQQQQMMMQQQQHQMQMQMRARLQQQQQQQQQMQTAAVGPRMSQLQQALQQRPQAAGPDLQSNMRQPAMVMPKGMAPGNFQMRPGLQTSGANNPQGPSPLPYAQSPQGGQMGNPSPGGTAPSPVGGQNRSTSLAPSPSSQVNTPLAPPASQEEKEYLEKVKSLEKYIEPLRKMILRIGNEDNEKLLKMKKLLDIMSNPDKRMPLVTLQKCEDVLKRMQLETADTDQSDSGLGSSTDKNALFEAINKLRQAGKAENLNNSLSCTFLPPMEAVMGPEISLPDLPRTPTKVSVQDDIPDIVQGEIARLDQRFRVWLDSSQPKGLATSVQIVCELDDRDLPAVPLLHVTIPKDYPESPPEINIQDPDYLSTPFLREVSGALSSRLEKMSSLHTLSQLLTAWELSVRSACIPSPFKNVTSNPRILNV